LLPTIVLLVTVTALLAPPSLSIPAPIRAVLPEIVLFSTLSVAAVLASPKF